MADENEKQRTDPFSAVISWLVENREQFPNNKLCEWSQRDIDHIKLGLSLMTQEQRDAFMFKYRDYQIVKILSKDD